MPDPKVNLPTPQPQPVSTRIAFQMAYGGGPGSTNANTYRVDRGFPFHRAGVAVTVASQFQTLALNTGSAVGLHSPVNQNAITNGLVDPAKSGFAQTGSNVPTMVTVPFTFAAGSPTTLTISWPAWPIRRANRTLLVASDTTIPAGSIAITGLVANTQYFYYPFWSEAAKTLGWAGAGNATSVGNPAIAQTVQTDLVLQSAFYQGFVPLNVLNFTQPAAGASTLTGGYGTGNTGITGGGRTYRFQ